MMELKENDLFSDFKKYLLLFEYPLIRGMDDEQIAEIFKSPNRCFLITWMLKILDSSYTTKLQNFENNLQFLGNILYELGFCAAEKGVSFMTGKLAIREQLLILLKIFKFMKNVTQNVNENAIKNRKCITNDDILHLKSMNLNIFPVYGDIRVSNKVTNIPNNQDIVISVEGPEDYNICNVEESLEEFKGILQKVTENFLQFKELSKLLIQKDGYESETNIKLHPDFGDILNNCHRCLKIIAQYFEDVNTIQNFHFSKVCNSTVTKNNRNELKEALNILLKEFSTIAELGRN